MGTRDNPWFFLSILLLCFSLKTHLSNGVNNSIISPGQSLSGNQNISSDGGNFILGFFKPGNNTQKHYIGIWLKKVSEQTVVWVANRETPLSDPSSSELKLSEDGNLVLLNQNKTLIWSTNSTSLTSNSTEAVLLDDGNLVLRDGSDSSSVFWQSFDHPSHTWLPGSKLGLNKLTNKSQLLTSWKNQEDPAPGIYSLELSPTTEYLIKLNRTIQYWSTGVWDDQSRIFKSVPEMRTNYIYNFSFISNENESYFIYSVYNSDILTRFIMDVTGQIKQLTWLESSKLWNVFWVQPKTQCEVFAYCGVFGSCKDNSQTSCECLKGFEPQFSNDWLLKDYSGGCVRKTPLQCEKKLKDKFLPLSYEKLPVNSESLATGSGSAQECESSCLNNCSCIAYTYENGLCSIWIGDLLNLQQPSDGDSTGNNFYLRLDPSEIPNSGGKKNNLAIIGAVAGVIALLILCSVLMVISRLQKRRSIGTSKAVEGSLIAFGYKDLQTVTKNFSEKLGAGGFGSVFKGTLPDSSVIAVKKLEGLRQGEKQFRTEVSTIGTIQHVNLVRLRGFCSEDTKRLLVYDYMPNGSLESHLFHQKDSQVLDWKTRYQIALGTARGLAYLHEKCRDCIIHCDIKPENILLDLDFCPKVADFGLAKLIGREFSRVLTTMRGTRGYLAPEWISGVAITPKADVYSYGMMLFEIISGRRNAEQDEDKKIGFFPTWAASIITQGEDILILLDRKLEGNADLEELFRASRVACWCIQDEEAHRPSMGQVVQILEGVLEVNMPPVPRTLQALAENEENIVFFSDSSNKTSQAKSGTTSSSSSQTKSITTSSSSSKNLNS